MNYFFLGTGATGLFYPDRLIAGLDYFITIKKGMLSHSPGVRMDFIKLRNLPIKRSLKPLLNPIMLAFHLFTILLIAVFFKVILRKIF
jgi:hypothetical protein